MSKIFHPRALIQFGDSCSPLLPFLYNKISQCTFTFNSMNFSQTQCKSHFSGSKFWNSPNNCTMQNCFVAKQSYTTLFWCKTLEYGIFCCEMLKYALWAEKNGWKCADSQLHILSCSVIPWYPAHLHVNILHSLNKWFHIPCTCLNLLKETFNPF